MIDGFFSVHAVCWETDIQCPRGRAEIGRDCPKRDETISADKGRFYRYRYTNLISDFFCLTGMRIAEQADLDSDWRWWEC